ncbi:MAG: ribosome silencing factor [Candidatus Limnocylindrales bacterium]
MTDPILKSPASKTAAKPAESTTARRPGLPARDVPTRMPGMLMDEQAALALARRVVDLASDKKAADIVLIGIGALTTLADYLVICSGGSERQLGAIADGILEDLKADGLRPIGREGGPGAHWVLIDLGAVIVHVFAPPERDFYQLEKLWADAPTLLRVQ